MNRIYEKNYINANDLIELENFKLRLVQPMTFENKAKREKQLLAPLDDKLTKRELEILKLICKGLSDTEIATLEIIATTTVLTHRQNLYDKLYVNSRLNLVLKAFELGLVEPPSVKK